MTDKQENKLSMAKAVQLVLQNNSTIVSTIVAFATAATDLDNAIDTIDGIVQLQVKQITGKAIDKGSAEQTAIAAALELVGPTKSYARFINDNTLYETVDYSKTSLQRLRDTELVNTLTLIRDTVQGVLANLADYGVTAAMTTALTQAIGTYSALVAAPRAAINIKSAATEALVTEFKKLDPLFDRLDGLAEIKKNTEADFYNTYKSARIIVDTGSNGGGPKDGKTGPTA